MRRLLIANRGEIAVRIARTAGELGIQVVAVHSEDDAASGHLAAADDAVNLEASGPAAYLDGGRILEVALAHGCDAVHPGYGFLSESEDFARRCAQEGLTFIGPAPETLALFGDKAQARTQARSVGVPVVRGTAGPTSISEARAFFDELGPGGAVMVKAIAGGGGRGMRSASTHEELDQAFTRCSSEAESAFGDGRLYLEQLLPRARHIEVQIVGDGSDVSHLWDRDCSLQRQRQKVLEIAPAYTVDEQTREQLFEFAVALCRSVRYRGLCTVEFLVPLDAPHEAVFIEANPRLQVEHTVTEEILGLDLVKLQIEIARGGSLLELQIDSNSRPRPRGIAAQARINLETMTREGTARPTGGVISAYEVPSGPGVRVDGFARRGYRTSGRYDSLLAKVVVHTTSDDQAALFRKTDRALEEFRIGGVETNTAFLRALLRDPDVRARGAYTTLIHDHIEDLVDHASVLHVAVEERDGPSAPAPVAETQSLSSGHVAVAAPTQGTVLSVEVAVGDLIPLGHPVAVLEAMKMEHLIASAIGGRVSAVLVEAGDTVLEGQPLVTMEPAEVEGGYAAVEESIDLEAIRADLAEVLDRRERALDGSRPAAVAKRHKLGFRTIRENISQLTDGGFAEYGRLMVAARRARNTLEELIAQTPADGLVMGLAHVNTDLFGEEAATRCAVIGYDYTVLAGTQGAHNHVKVDRMAELALRWQLPTVFFTEGGGGRPGDTEIGGTFIRMFEWWGKLSGAVPLVGITSGRCFAGNAAILGCCDVIIATKSSSLGMAGPVMIEGGGLGVFSPEEIGPVEVMEENGVIDVLVDDEAEAVKVAKQYLSYFQGPVADWSCADQRLLRFAVPENRLRGYDVRSVIETLADEGSVLEVRPRFGKAMITAFLRIEGRPMGVIANNPMHLGGAIDSDASDKAARFMQVCEAFDLPLLSLSDTPGNMVGPEAEKTGLIRHCSRMFVIGANLTVPILSVILRKSYGLGAVAMTGGSYQASMFCISWPTGEFGGMGLEGYVKLGFKDQLEAVADPDERDRLYESLIAQAYEKGRALNRATGIHLDDVIDPATTRDWVVAALSALPPAEKRTGKKLPWIDAW